MSFGTGGGTNLIGTYPIANIDPGQHVYAYIDWFFSSALIHRCLMVRADCPGDPAASVGSPVESDDNQAQRNLDPLFAGFGEAAPGPQVIERTFVVRNPGPGEAVFTVVPGKSREKNNLIRTILPDSESLRRMILKPREQRELKVRFMVSPQVKPGQKLRFPLEVRRLSPERRSMGGVTFTVEIADGRLEGRLVNREGAVPARGSVTIQNIKQPDLQYSTTVGRMNRFSFPHIVPGPYRISVGCGRLEGQGAVFVEPDRITTIVLPIALRRELPTMETVV